MQLIYVIPEIKMINYKSIGISFRIAILVILATYATFTYSQQNTPSFRAEGEHQCQSPTDIGHMCKTFGVNFNDCLEAAASLKGQDCCSSTLECTDLNGDFDTIDPGECKFGGRTIGFTMGICSPL